MKKIILVLILSPLFLANYKLAAQSWVNGGNNLTATGRLGTTSYQSVAFITNNTERGRITNGGNWGIGTSSPASKLAVNSASGVSPFRAQVNGYTKLLVHSGGGVAIGANTTPPSNGLYVLGSVGIGTSSPSYKLHVAGDATITQGLYVQDYGISTYNSTGSYGTYSYGSYAGVYGSGGSYGVYGSGGTNGVYGTGSSYGVNGYSYSGYGGNFTSYNSYGLVARTTNGYYAGVFYGHVYASDGYVTSDKNLKTNIQEVGDAMSIINKLKPRHYEFKKDAKFASLQLPKGNHYGLLAQDLQDVLPNLVSEAPHELKTVKPQLAIKPETNGKPSAPAALQQETIETINIKAVNYVELIPIMVKAMQEQEATIEKQNEKIEALTQMVNQLKSSNTELPDKLSGISLSQNTPNPPIANSTRVNFKIPSGTTTATLILTNTTGQKLKQFKLNESGIVDINTSSLSSGTYFYTLYVGGKSYDTKKMVINR